MFGKPYESRVPSSAILKRTHPKSDIVRWHISTDSVGHALGRHPSILVGYTPTPIIVLQVMPVGEYLVIEFVLRSDFYQEQTK